MNNKQKSTLQKVMETNGKFISVNFLLFLVVSGGLQWFLAVSSICFHLFLLVSTIYTYRYKQRKQVETSRNRWNCWKPPETTTIENCWKPPETIKNYQKSTLQKLTETNGKIFVNFQWFLVVLSGLQWLSVVSGGFLHLFPLVSTCFHYWYK